jgi:hypothetical protein
MCYLKIGGIIIKDSITIVGVEILPVLVIRWLGRKSSKRTLKGEHRNSGVPGGTSKMVFSLFLFV